MPNKIRILFLCDEILQATAGSEQHLSFLLWNLPRGSYDISFVILRQHDEFPRNFSPTSPDILNFESFKNPAQVVAAVYSLRKMIQQRDIRIVQTFFPDSEILGALASLGNHRCRVVIARRDMGYEKNIKSRIQKRFLRFISSNYLSNCQAVKNYLIKQERICSNKIAVIFNPINEKRLQPDDTMDRRRLKIEDNASVVGIVANIRPVKDYETFFRAAAIVRDQISGVRFIVVGSGQPEYVKQIKLLVEELSLTDRVIFTGPVSKPLAIVSLFDIGVLTSKSEGLSNSLIEYAVMGIPTVATDVGGNCEIVEEGKTGYLIPPSLPQKLSEKIIELLKDGEKRKTFAMQAKLEAAEKFKQSEIIRQYESYHRNLMKERSPYYQ